MPQAELITRIRHAPKRAPCPTCGRRGRRKRVLRRRLRTLAYRRVAWLEVTYAEYQARCRCRKFFRTWPLQVPQKADHDATVRQAVAPVGKVHNEMGQVRLVPVLDIGKWE